MRMTQEGRAKEVKRDSSGGYGTGTISEKPALTGLTTGRGEDRCCDNGRGGDGKNPPARGRAGCAGSVLRS